MLRVLLFELTYPARRGFFLASILACTESFTFLVCRAVGYFTSPRETFATSRLHFPLSMRFKYLQLLRGNEFKRICQLMCIYILLFCCAKMSLREVERWLPKVFLVYFVAKQLRIE